jgi:hypothetical protein
MRESIYEKMSIEELRAEHSKILSNWKLSAQEKYIQQEVCWSVLDRKEIEMCQKLYREKH